MGLYIENVSHAFGGHRVFDDLSVSVPSGDIVCLLGPSGCGKTTLLRLAAGLERLQKGEIKFSDRLVASAEFSVPPEQRGVGLMFQDFALFPHLNVADNVAFGISYLSAAEKQLRTVEVLQQVTMQDYADAYPHTLSGGQQQRVALARALAPRPAVILLDEPFSGLDQNMRIQIREETLGILKSAGVATLMVTHNPDEAMFMADRIMVMGADGSVLQEGTPNEVYAEPAHPYVASFFGQVNQLTGTAASGKIETILGDMPVPSYPEGCNVDVVIRPYGIKLAEGGDKGVPVEILNARPLGRNTFIRFRVKGQGAETPDFHCRKPGVFPESSESEVRAWIDPDSAFVFPRTLAGDDKEPE
jgi:iron(III) transport system ATP-binding protein